MSKPVPAEPSDQSHAAVIVTVYNKAPYVGACIRSVLTQTLAPIEFVVVDDGSTDGSVEIVTAALAGSGAQLLRPPNGGVSRARTLGLQACRTRPRYLLFLDGDDVLLPDALQTMCAHMDRHPGVAMCYSVPLLIDADGAALGVDTDQVRWAATTFGRRSIADAELETPIEAIWAHFRAMPSACLVRRSSYEQTAGWDEAMCRPARPFQVEDKDMAIQLALVGQIHRIQAPTVQYRVLPTIHRQTLYDGLRQIDRKWWNLRLDAATRRIVRHAIRFDSRVVMLDAAQQLGSALRSGSVTRMVPAAVSLLRAVARLLSLPVRLRSR
jgi:glycosyltransferase involved in cell wall biosynthesis